MYVSVSDLALFILFLAVIVIAVYLIAVLRRAFNILGHIREILTAHDGDIRRTLSILPAAVENVNALVSSLKDTIDQTSTALCTLQDDLVDDLRDGLETFSIYAKVIVDIFRAVFSKLK